MPLANPQRPEQKANPLPQGAHKGKPLFLISELLTLVPLLFGGIQNGSAAAASGAASIAGSSGKTPLSQRRLPLCHGTPHVRHLLCFTARLPTPRIGAGSLRAGMLGLIACVCATLVVTEGLQLWRVYQTNNQQTEVVSANIARSLADQADAALKTADTIAASLVERVEADGLSPEAKHRLYGLMTSLAAALPAIHEMGITDPRGNAIVKSLVPDPTGLNYAERAYFQYHATHPSRRPFIGERIRSKIDQTDNITVTRRIDQPDGSFGGVVVTSVSLGYFQRLFDQIQAKSGGIIALVADDGTVLVRSPASSDIDRPSEGAGVARQIRGHPEAGTVSYVSAIDGVRRRGAYVRLAHYPLTVLVSQSVWDLQSGWRGELHAHAVILGCFLIVVAALATLAVKASRNPQRAGDA